MRIAIVGSRPQSMKEFAQAAGTYTDFILSAAIVEIMNRYIRRDGVDTKPTLISGGADGIDALAEGMARGIGYPCIIFKPEWTKYGKSAGFKRNQKIVDAADEVIAFHFEGSSGTADTIRRAKESGKPLTILTPAIVDDGVHVTFNVERINHA